MKVWIGNLKDGRRLTRLPHTQATWSVEVNRTDATSCTVPLHASSNASEGYRRIVADARLLDPLNTITIGKTYLVVEDDGMSAGGPVTGLDYDAATARLNVTGAGMWTYFDHRTVLPVAADTKPLVGADGKPDGSLDTIFSPSDGLSIRTIAKRVVQQAVDWPDSLTCIAYEDDWPGTAAKTYRAVNLVYVGTVLTNITRLRLGCDVMFQPRRQTDGLGFEWLLRTGNPRIGSVKPHLWDFTARKRDLGALSGSTDGSRLATRAWFTGGRTSDRTLVEHADNRTLIDAGAPMWESVDSSHSTVEDPATLRDMAAERVRTTFMGVSGRSFAVARTAIDLNVVRPGDLCAFKTRDDPFFGSGWHRRRILSMAASTGDPGFITLETTEQYGDSDVDPDAPSEEDTDE